jgi:hypothetical protein
MVLVRYRRGLIFQNIFVHVVKKFNRITSFCSKSQSQLSCPLFTCSCSDINLLPQHTTWAGVFLHALYTATLPSARLTLPTSPSDSHGRKSGSDKIRSDNNFIHEPRNPRPSNLLVPTRLVQIQPRMKILTPTPTPKLQRLSSLQIPLLYNHMLAQPLDGN